MRRKKGYKKNEKQEEVEEDKKKQHKKEEKIWNMSTIVKHTDLPSLLKIEVLHDAIENRFLFK